MSLVYTWLLPTKNTNGTPIKTSGRGALVETVVQFGRVRSDGTREVIENRHVPVPKHKVSFTPPQSGKYFVTAFVKNAYGKESVWSPILMRTV